MKLFVKILVSVLFALGILLGFSCLVSMEESINFIQAVGIVTIITLVTLLFIGIIWLIFEMWDKW